MNKRNFLIGALALLMAVPSVRVEAQKNGGQPGFKKFAPKETLDGVWQLCSIKEEEGQVRINHMPFLCVIDADGKYQKIFIRSESGSRITETGAYTKVNDSTLTRAVEFTADSAVLKYDDTFTSKLQRRTWLLNTYRSKDGKEPLQELWMRVMPGRVPSMAGGGRSGQFGPRAGRGQGQRPQGSQGQNFRRQRGGSSSGVQNPFQEEMDNARQMMDDDD